ncbi:MAG: response regulator [Patescibacteria group bacterium]
MAEKKKVLVAEDDKFLAVALADKLERDGFQVIRAVNGEEALQKAKQELPDLIILDLIMPHKNGFQVLEELRLDLETAALKVVVLSNLGQESDIEKAKALGALDYWVKSDTELKVIAARVKDYLGK